MHAGHAEWVYPRRVKSIQIRDVPDEVHASLRAMAATAGLSLSEYLLREATKIASRPSMSEVLKRASRREWGVPPGSAVEVLRGLRDDEAESQ
jgi:plasmid stability protein